MKKSVKETWNLFLGLRELKRRAPEIKSLFRYFEKSENPKKILEKIIIYGKKNPILDNLLKISKTYEMILRTEQRAEKKDWGYACDEALKEMEVNYEIIGKENIPKSNALYISNHPYGIVDGAILLKGLGSLLNETGRKLKLIAMDGLKFIKGFEDVVYFIHPTIKINIGPIRESLRYITNGGDLAIYPSGTISGAELKEYPWKSGLESFVSHSSYTVPMWFSGPDHEGIYNFFAKHKRTEELRNIFSLRGVWNKSGKTVVLNIGKPIRAEELKKIGNNGEKVKYLRQVAESLKVTV